jgi:hypothetical protein
MPADAESWIELARSFLEPERSKMVLEMAPPDPAPGDIGAIAGFGGVAEDCDVRVSSYVFDEWGGGVEPAEVLKARAEAEGRRTLVIVNGPLLLFATGGSADRDRFALFDLSSAFSGFP